MKVIIAGGRDFVDIDMFEEAINELNTVVPITEVVSGMAKGADSFGVLFADLEQLPLHKFPADWDKYGNRAGPIRNREMAEFADALIAFWDGKSRGTKNMIEEAKKRDLIVKIVYY